MSINICIGDALTRDQEVKITDIHFAVGDTVQIDDVLVDYETEKATIEFTSEVAGIIESINLDVGDIATADTLIMSIRADEQTDVSGNVSDTSVVQQEEELNADITIIGGGPGGYVAAIKAAQLGKKVVVVEKENLGGTCLNWGCIPTKALVRSAEVLDLIKHADEFGISASNVNFDMHEVIARKNKVVKQLVDGIGFLFTKNDITLVQGSAEMLDATTVYAQSSTTKTTINTKNIIIATGSVSTNLPIPGADFENVIDSKQALDLTELPKMLTIVGGGVIGMEFAFIFASFGVDVSVVEYAPSCLANCDYDVIQEIEQAAKDKGIKFYTNAKVEEVIKTESGDTLVAFSQDGSKKYLPTETVLMAVGRTPFFDGIGVEKLGIELNEKGRGIKVDETMQTNIPNIYAIGDVTNIIQLAHVASHQGIVAVDNIAGIESKMHYHAVPSAIFTHPEIGMVGLTEKEAQEKVLDIQVAKFPFVANGKALALGESQGFIKIIAEKESNKVLGASIIGPNATDMIAELTLAIQNNLTTQEIIETIHAHPTTAEVVHEASLSIHDGAIHF